MKRTRKVAFVFLAILLFCGFLPGFSASAESTGAPLSPAISVLSKDTDVALWGLAGETQVLDRECFLRGLNLSNMTSVRILTLPDRTVGILSYEGKRVETGQTFSSSELLGLCFVPTSSGIGATAFSFEINSCGVEYTCRLYSLKEVNASPSLASVPTLLQSLSVHKNSSRAGIFFAEDPEGDSLVYEIASYPQYGSLNCSGNTYVYKPFSNYTGVDSFSYVARDRYGNYSASMKVSITVTAVGSDLVFSDVSDPAIESAARTLSVAGILGGTEVGSKTYFYPDRALTRLEFLVSAMSASGMTDLPACTDTGFADDCEIPESMKPYVFAAYRLGYLNGKVQGGEVFFAPNEPITQGEAADVLERLLLPDTAKTSVKVSGNVGAKTKASVSALASIGVISPIETSYPANELLTRGDAAKLLEKVFFLTNAKKF